MAKIKISTQTQKRLRIPALVLFATVGLSACQTVGFGTTPAQNEGIGYRQARFEQISAMRSYRTCKDEALTLDSQARKSADPAKYLASARLLESCEAELGIEAREVGQDERMRAYAVSIQNRLKGGDINGARENLMKFKQAFPNRDLYLPDGASFVESMELLVGERTGKKFMQLTLLNVSPDLKNEYRRTRYWKHN